LAGRQFGGSIIWQVDNLAGQHFDGLNNLAGQQFGESTFWWVDILMGQHFGGLTICRVDNLAGRHFGSRQIGIRPIGSQQRLFYLHDIFIGTHLVSRPE
jgi:hypothetical protein